MRFILLSLIQVVAINALPSRNEHGNMRRDCDDYRSGSRMQRSILTVAVNSSQPPSVIPDQPSDDEATTTLRIVLTQTVCPTISTALVTPVNTPAAVNSFRTVAPSDNVGPRASSIDVSPVVSFLPNPTSSSEIITIRRKTCTRGSSTVTPAVIVTDSQTQTLGSSATEQMTMPIPTDLDPSVVSTTLINATSSSTRVKPTPWSFSPTHTTSMPVGNTTVSPVTSSALPAHPFETTSTVTRTITRTIILTSTEIISGVSVPPTTITHLVTTTDIVTVFETSVIFTTLAAPSQSSTSASSIYTPSVAPFPQFSTPVKSTSSAEPSTTYSVSTIKTTVISIETLTFTTSLLSTLSTSQSQSVTTSPTTTPSTMVASTEIPTTGQPPVITASSSISTSPLTLITTGTNKINSTRSVTMPTAVASNVFVPVATDAPPTQIRPRGDHPVPRLGIMDQNSTIATNKFYANFFLGSQNQSTWTHPYSVSRVSNGYVGMGLGISHVEASQRVFDTSMSPPRYFINPLGLQSVIISASELEVDAEMTLDALTAFSVNVNLSPSSGAQPAITFPLVQGMGFTTGVFQKATPQLGSTLSFASLRYDGLVGGTKTAKYSVMLRDGRNWLVYMTPDAGYSLPTLSLVDGSQILGNAPFSGTVQVAKVPQIGNYTLPFIRAYDSSAGVYATSAMVAARVSESIGNYTLSWTKAGQTSRPLLMWALPHHQQSIVPMAGIRIINDMKLQTTTKGQAMAIIGDSWTLSETNLPYDMGFAPWTPTQRSTKVLAASTQELVNSAATTELAQDMSSQSDSNSMYYAGKVLAKYAMAVYATADLANNLPLASAGLAQLKDAFSRFVNNTQINPLAYDTSWGGAVSTSGYSDAGADFGNTYYNDHHFHYGYFVYAAAVIGTLDPAWLRAGTNKAWVDMLVRDYANSVADDPYFPFSRMFDWYHGHSWAHGLYESADGKDQESSSEDAFASYALKMWGKATGDANMEARGNLMLAVQARALSDYYLLQSDNSIQPAPFVPNRAAGIIFENKIDHTTYFGTNVSYIEGIHMLPLNPSSALTRKPEFVSEEWETYFSNGRADAVQGGWKGILYANLALVDPKRAYEFFADPDFESTDLDGGASRTWYLAYCAGLGGL